MTQHTDSVETLRQEFTKWLTVETTFATGVPDDRSIADWWLEKIATIQATHQQQVEEAVRKEREQTTREVNSFSARYPEYGIRLYQWEDGTLGMDTISFEDAVNNKQGSFRPYLYKEDLTPNHQD